MRDRAYDTDSYALEAGYRFHCAAHRTNLETELSTSEVSDRSYPQASRNGWTADARAIYTVYMMTIESFRTHRHSRSNVVGGVWVFRTVCFERVVLSSPGCLWPGRMDDHEEVLEAHA